jgi:hypothetical protein
MDDVDVTLLYFDGCPNWHQAEDRVRQALATVGLPQAMLTLHRVETPEEAQRLSFRGSPTILVNGADPFADPTAPVGLACRVYRCGDATSGAPSVQELTAALRAVE